MLLCFHVLTFQLHKMRKIQACYQFKLDAQDYKCLKIINIDLIIKYKKLLLIFYHCVNQFQRKSRTMLEVDTSKNLNQLSLDKILLLRLPLNQLYQIQNFHLKVKQNPTTFAKYLKNNQQLLQQTIRLCFQHTQQKEQVSKQSQHTAIEIMTSGEPCIVELIVGKLEDAVKSISSNSSEDQEIYQDIITDKRTGKLVTMKSYNQGEDPLFFNSYHYLSILFQEIYVSQDNWQIIGYIIKLLESVLKSDFAIKIYNFLQAKQNENQLYTLLSLVNNPTIVDFIISLIFNQSLFQEKQFFNMQNKVIKQIILQIRDNILKSDNDNFYGYVYFMQQLYEAKDKYTIIGGIVTQQYGQLLKPFVSQNIVDEFVMKLFVTLQIINRQKCSQKISKHQNSCLNLLQYLNTIIKFEQQDEKNQENIEFLSSKNIVWSTQYQFDPLYKQITKFFECLLSTILIKNVFIVDQYVELLKSIMENIPIYMLSFQELIKYLSTCIDIFYNTNQKGIILSNLSILIEKIIQLTQPFSSKTKQISKLEQIFNKILQNCLKPQQNHDLQAHSKKLSIFFYTYIHKIKINVKELAYLQQVQQQHRTKLYGNSSTKYYFKYLQKSIKNKQKTNEKQQTDFNDSSSENCHDIPENLHKEFPDIELLECNNWEQQIIDNEEQLNPQQLSIQ